MPRPWRILIVTIIGYAILIIGIIMLPLPGPGTLIILIGLTVLALEFEWAREANKQGHQWLERIVYKIKAMLQRKAKDND